MSEIVYINDPRGGRVPLTDEFGNLSIDVMFLYNEGKLPEEAIAMVDEIVANDEMAKDALEGYALMNSAPKAKAIVGDIGHQITTGKSSKTVAAAPIFTGRTWAIAASLALILGLGSVMVGRMMQSDDLAVNEPEIQPEQNNTTVKKTTSNRPEFNLASDSVETRDESVRGDQQGLGSVTGETLTVQEDITVAEDEAEETPSPSAEKEELLAKMAKLKEKQKALSNQALAAQHTLEGNANANGVMDELAVSQDVSYDLEEESEIAASSMNERKKMPSSNTAMEADVARKVDKDRSAESTDANIVYHDPRTFFSFELVEDRPVFPGGDIKMWEFIERNKNHAEDLKSRAIGGDVFVSFVINESGKVTNVEILSSNAGSPQLEDDAKRVIRSMPKWAPGKMNGNPVKVTKTMMVRYPVN